MAVAQRSESRQAAPRTAPTAVHAVLAGDLADTGAARTEAAAPRRRPHLPATAGAPGDPRPSIARAYRFERARRTLRSEHRDERRRADRRFWLTLAVLGGGAAAVAVATISELQRLFGI